MKKGMLFTRGLALAGCLCGIMTATVSAAGYNAAHSAVSEETVGDDRSLLSEPDSEENVEYKSDDVLSEVILQSGANTEIMEDSLPEAVSQSKADAEAIKDTFSEVLSVPSADVSDSQNYIYLSDISYEDSMSNTQYETIKMDENLSGNNISLIVNGSAMEFDKGIFAHATSTVVYDVSAYSDVFTRFTSYAGVDRSQGSNGNGVWFSVSVSQDGQIWEEIEKTSVLKGDSEAHFLMWILQVQNILNYMQMLTERMAMTTLHMAFQEF